MSCCSRKGRGTPLNKILIIKATCDPERLSEHKGPEEGCSPNQSKISVIHKTLQPIPTKKKKKITLQQDQLLSVPSLKKKKKWDGCYLTQSPVTFVPGLLRNTELFNDANYKQRENIRRVCLEISLLDWKLASLIELAGLRFSLRKPGLELWSICIISLVSRTLGIVEN